MHYSFDLGFFKPMSFFKISTYTHILYLETKHIIQVFEQNIISFQWQTRFSNLEDSALSPFRARWTAGKQPYPKSSPNLHYSEFINCSLHRAGTTDLTVFTAVQKVGLSGSRGCYRPKRRPFPSHNLSKFPPQLQKHYRDLEPNSAASLCPQSWKAEQHPLSKSTLILLYQGKYTLPWATAFCASALVTLLWNNWGIMRQKTKGLAHMEKLLGSRRYRNLISWSVPLKTYVEWQVT